MNSIASSLGLHGLAATATVTGSKEVRLHRIDAAAAPRDSSDEITVLPSDYCIGGIAAAALVCPLASAPEKEASSGAGAEVAASGGGGGGEGAAAGSPVAGSAPGGSSSRIRSAFVVARPDRQAPDAVDELIRGLRAALDAIGCADLLPAEASRELARRREAAVKALRRSSGAVFGLLYL